MHLEKRQENIKGKSFGIHKKISALLAILHCSPITMANSSISPIEDLEDDKDDKNNKIEYEIFDIDGKKDSSDGNTLHVHAEQLSQEFKFFTMTAEDLKNGPFDVNNPQKAMIKLNYGNLLGEGQARTILDYNGLKGNTKNDLMQPSDTLRIPLIFPELLLEFPSSRETFIAEKGFEKFKDCSSENKIVVTKCSNGMHALAYYKNGILTMATYVSIGTSGAKTIEGEFPVGDKNMRRRSHKYNNSPMPYSIHIKDGYFIHQGESNGTPRSHGCIRVPGLYQIWLYNEMNNFIKDNTKIILYNLY